MPTAKPPQRAQDLIDLTEIRIATCTHKVTMLKLEEKDLIFKTQKPAIIQNLLTQAPGRISVIDQNLVYYRPPQNYLSPPATLLAILRKILVRPLRDDAAA